MNKYIRLRAFSMLELMICLIAISVMASALVPAITKKSSSQDVRIDAATIRTVCTPFGADCDLCYEEKCIVCTANCPIGQIKRIDDCKCITCAEAGFPNCADCTSVEGKCSKCNAGYYLTASKTCEPCPAGSSCNGLTKTACAAGTYSAAKAASCTPCPAGQYNTGTGNTGCTKCSAGQYQGSTGKTSCTPCPAGQYNTGTGNSGCTKCPAGQYQGSTGKTSCSACPTNTYSDTTGASSCTACSTSCQNGACSSTTGVCTSCAQSYYVNGKVCSACIAGCAYCSNNTTCDTCHWGYWRNSSLKCEGCPAGYYCRSNGKTICPAGNYCPAGSNWYTACTAGKAAAQGASGCSTCSAGTYSGAGAASCTACPAGQTSGAGASGCYACGVTGCTAYSSGCTCSTCSTGYYVSGGTCKACKAECYTCTNGTSCTSCAANYHMTARNGNTCVPCPSDATASAGNKYEFCIGPPTKSIHCPANASNPWSNENGGFENHGWWTASVKGCVTSRVSGDGEIGDTWQGIKYLNASSKGKCTKSQRACCWKGVTTSDGDKRPVCTREAAEILCNWKSNVGIGAEKGGYSFRLMNATELDLLCSSTFSNSKANAMDKNHAGFCASLGSNSYYAQCNQYQDHCPVDGLGNNNHCHANNVIGTGTNYLYLIKQDGKVQCKTPTGEKYSAGTVRCITTSVRRWNENYTVSW